MPFQSLFSWTLVSWLLGMLLNGGLQLEVSFEDYFSERKCSYLEACFLLGTSHFAAVVKREIVGGKGKSHHIYRKSQILHLVPLTSKKKMQTYDFRGRVYYIWEYYFCRNTFKDFGDIERKS